MFGSTLSLGYLHLDALWWAVTLCKEVQRHKEFSRFDETLSDCCHLWMKLRNGPAQDFTCNPVSHISLDMKWPLTWEIRWEEGHSLPPQTQCMILVRLSISIANAQHICLPAACFISIRLENKLPPLKIQPLQIHRHIYIQHGLQVVEALVYF